MTYGKFSRSQMISAVSSNFSADPFDILWCKALVLMDLQLDH